MNMKTFKVTIYDKDQITNTQKLIELIGKKGFFFDEGEDMFDYYSELTRVVLTTSSSIFQATDHDLYECFAEVEQL